MDEATKQALNEFVKQSLGAISNGAALAAEQAPLLVREWILWQTINAGLFFVLFLALSVWWYRRTFPKCRVIFKEDEMLGGFAYAGSGIVQLLLLLFVGMNLETFLMVTFAPRYAVAQALIGLAR